MKNPKPLLTLLGHLIENMPDGTRSEQNEQSLALTLLKDVQESLVDPYLPAKRTVGDELRMAAAWLDQNPHHRGSPIETIKALRAETRVPNPTDPRQGDITVSLLVAKMVCEAMWPEFRPRATYKNWPKKQGDEE